MHGKLIAEVANLNRIRGGFFYRLALGELVIRHGLDRVRTALIVDAARMGTISIAAASDWAKPSRERRTSQPSSAPGGTPA